MTQEYRQSPMAYFRSLTALKKLFWLYFLLWIFEGALRKWVFPGFSAELLLVRDPIALFIIFEGMRTGKWPARWTALTALLFAGLISLCLVQVVVGDNSWVAAAYGLRSYLLPFPTAFVMGENLNKEDLRRFGVFTLWLLAPMTLLEVAQYLAPTGSVLNTGAYRGASQIASAGSHLRSSGTFSFVTGPSSFGPLAAAFLLFAIVDEGFTKRWLIWVAAASLILSIPVVGSRTLVFELAGTLGCATIAAFSGVKQFFKMLRIAVPLAVVTLLVSLLPVFSQASSTLVQRFSEASTSEGTISNTVKSRSFGSVLDALESVDFSTNPGGIGMGKGANAVTKLETGEARFAAGEDELSREIIELGPLPGLSFALLRYTLAIFVIVKALQKARGHEPFALLMLPIVAPGLFLAPLEQPTGQGILVICMAFTIAALSENPVILRRPARSKSIPHNVRYREAVR